MSRLRRLLVAVPHVAKRWGDALYDRGHVRRAIACYRWVIPLRRPVGPFVGRWIVSLPRLANLEAAIAFHRDNLARVPRHQPSSHILARLLAQTGRILEAEAQYRETIALDPSQAQVHADLLALLMPAHRYGEAEIVCRKLDHLRPDDPTVLRTLVTILTGHGRWVEAEATQRRLIEAGADEEDALQELHAARTRWEAAQVSGRWASGGRGRGAPIAPSANAHP